MRNAPRNATSVALSMDEGAAALEDDEEMGEWEEAFGDEATLPPNLPTELELKVGLTVFHTSSWLALVEATAEEFEGLNADGFEDVEIGTVLPFMDRIGSASMHRFCQALPIN